MSTDERRLERRVLEPRGVAGAPRGGSRRRTGRRARARAPSPRSRRRAARRRARARGTPRPRRASPSSTPASTSASAITSSISSTCARLAISGTTPPKRACRSTWLDTTDERTSRPSSTTAAAVSSHDVSMPRIARHHQRRAARTTVAPGDAVARCASSSAAYSRLVDLVRPHHERVLVRLGVVALAHADRAEAEPAVQLLRRRVRQPDLERERGRLARRSPRARARAAGGCRSGAGATPGRPRSS